MNKQVKKSGLLKDDSKLVGDMHLITDMVDQMTQN